MAPAGSGPGNLVYTVTATNAGPAAASGITIDDVLTLPVGVTVVSVVPSSGTFTSPTWALGSLAPGVSETLTVTLTVGGAAATGTDVISNKATVKLLSIIQTTNDYGY